MGMGLRDMLKAGMAFIGEEEPFFSVEDLQKRAGLTKSVIEILRKTHVLDNLNETDQLSFF